MQVCWEMDHVIDFEEKIVTESTPDCLSCTEKGGIYPIAYSTQSTFNRGMVKKRIQSVVVEASSRGKYYGLLLYFSAV